VRQTYGKPKQQQKWAVYSGSHPMVVARTRQQAIDLMLFIFGKKYTWEQLSKKDGYSVVKCQIVPTQGGGQDA
jgi:hypothetical protein